MTIILTIGVFLITLTGMLLRPRGFHEAWFAVAGGVLMLALRLETPAQAITTVARGGDVLLFLLALMLLSALLDCSGFFEYAAIVCARGAGGSSDALFRNVFLLGAMVTAFLSLDTTAIILTPIVVATVLRLRLGARPFVLASAFVANTGSLLLPVSNLTNLLFQSRYHFSFAGFAARMVVPQVVALLVNYLMLRRRFAAELTGRFGGDDLPLPSTAVPDVSFFRAAVVVVVAVLVGFFAASLLRVPPYLVAFAGSSVLVVAGLIRRRIDVGRLLRDVSWALFPFVIGLFVVVRGVENLGLTSLTARALALAGGNPAAQAVTAALGAGVGVNVVNNIPMGLLALASLKGATAVHAVAGPAVYGALIGCNIGPNLTVIGSLATMLVLSSARRRGIDIGGVEFLRVGLIVTPLTLLAAALALSAEPW